MITLTQCHGCRDDFYNHGGHALDGKRCWSATDGEMVTRYKIGTWTTPTIKGAFTKVKVPSCYHGEGVHFYKQLPDFVKPSDLNRANRVKRSA